MESTRQSKIARLIQKELSEIFLLQAKSMAGVLVSVTSVRVSPDLSIARAYISIFPSERGDEIVSNLNGNVRSIRYELGGRLRHQLRIIPELKFFIDDSLDYLERIDELLNVASIRIIRYSGNSTTTAIPVESPVLHSSSLPLLQEVGG